MSSRDPLDWTTDGRDWPLREHCRFVDAAGLRWLVMEMGQGPSLVLVHGTGASLHSWRGLAPLLAAQFRVIAFDLPGHGFTSPGRPEQCTLPGMAAAIADLLAVIDVAPSVAVGHSAGAALAVRMTLDGAIAPATIVSLNGAFIPFRGPVGRFFSPIAKLLTLNPFVPSLVAWRASDRETVARMLKDTGSTLDERGLELYARLASRPGHVAGALAMMAGWDLEPLLQELPKLRTPLVLVAASEDAMVPPAQAYEMKAHLRGATLVKLRRLGHLAHEERPDLVAGVIEEAARTAGILPPPEEPRR